MKNLRLFESFQEDSGWVRKGAFLVPANRRRGKEGEVLIGFYSDGGIGSHPAIVTPSMEEQIEKNPDQFKNFWPTSFWSSVPEAIICIYNSSDEWMIKAIRGSIARSIMDKIGGDHITSEDNLPLLNEIASMVGYRRSNRSDVTLISVIPKPAINTVYWSDNPESTHGYWEPPYEAIPIEDLL